MKSGRNIVGLCGLIGSGKGTVADYLCHDYKFQKLSFADALKDGVAGIFGYDRDMLEGDTSASRAARERPDAFWSELMGREITPRYILQIMGTEIMRQNFHPDIWVKLVEKELGRRPTAWFTIPDARFPNEVDMIREMGGEIWWVKRGPWPDWVAPWREMGIEPEGVHESEYMWMLKEPDRIIENDGDLEDLRDMIEEILDDT